MNALLSVLLVEDSRPQAELVIDLLQTSQLLNCHIRHVQRISEAQTALMAQPADVILLDMNLPDSRGLQGFRKLHSEYPHLPILIMTNEGTNELAITAMQEGAQDYLPKRDIDVRLLERSIQYAIQRLRYEQALLESEERYALAMAGATDGLWDWDLEQSRIYYSPRWKEILGFADDSFDNQIDAWLERVHEADIDALNRAIDAHLRGDTEHLQHEYRVLRRDGEYVWVQVRGTAIRNAEGRARRVAGSLTDISHRKAVESKLIHDAMHDQLTGLPNRSLLMNRLEQAIKSYARNKAPIFAVLYFDLDRFKHINDSLGHSAGDELLISVASRLNRFLRPGDTLARLGGDEFAILLQQLELPTDISHVGQRIHEIISEPFQIQGNTVYTSASVGITLSSETYQSAQDMLRDADLAMYRCKQSTNSVYEIFDNEMHASAVALLKLETDLKEALSGQQFMLHYQPIVSIKGLHITGIEALLRWQHPERGLLSPQQFIAVAEETGMIVPISWWVLREVCRQGKEWTRETGNPVSFNVNLSSKVLLQPNMVAELQSLLQEFDFPANLLRLEITESTMLEHSGQTRETLQAIQDLGVELYIDDFGTGYSSLAYLQQYSCDKLKIDQSFVSRMQEEADTNAIVRAIVALGKMLGMSVIAEGVETREQMDSLRAMQCEEMQGYLFSRPLDANALLSVLRQPEGLGAAMA